MGLFVLQQLSAPAVSVLESTASDGEGGGIEHKVELE